MAEYIHLIGVEQIQSAANSISSSAEEMKRAAESMEDSFRRHQLFLDDWLLRLSWQIAKANFRATTRRIL